ncbi:MAG: VTT domain-containing protein [Pirellulales bacterium]
MFGSLGRPLLVLTLVLAVPILPFVLFGSQLEAWFAALFDPPPSPLATWWLVATALATDVLLPVPSSLVSTLAGARLGLFGGATASWAGMSVGAAVGFALARRWGRPLAIRLASPEDIDRLDRLAARMGPAIVVLTRAVPVLAEASVLLLGINRLSWRKFLPALLLSNLGIALAYSAFGEFAGKHEWLPLALGISVAAPLAATAVARWTLARRARTNRDAA